MAETTPVNSFVLEGWFSSGERSASHHSSNPRSCHFFVWKIWF